MLDVRHLNVAYGQSQVLHGVNFAVKPGEIVAVVGRNGMGKSTLMKSLIGVMPSRSGQVMLDGADVTAMPSHARVKCGLSYVPQGRQIFGTMTVAENIATGRVVTGKSDIPDEIYSLFPILWEFRSAARRQPVGRPATATRHRAGTGERAENSPARRTDRRHSAFGDQGHRQAAQGDPPDAQLVHRRVRAGAEFHPGHRGPYFGPRERPHRPQRYPRAR